MGVRVLSEELLTCANEGCEETFLPKTHNMKYHNDECCRIATNRRIMEKYYERQAQRQGKTRYCKVCNTTKLSRYNDSQICSPCKTSREVSANDSVINMLMNASLSL